MFSFYYSIVIIFWNILFDSANIILKCQYFELKKKNEWPNRLII